MAFDGILMHAAAVEIGDAVTGARVEKVYQPEPLAITMRLYRDGRNLTLLISCHPRFARVHLTDSPRENPSSPPTFCRLLRSRLEGGRVTEVAQEGLERVLRLTVEKRPREGEPQRHHLVAEIMGKHSNLLILSDEGNIVDALRRVPPHLSRLRIILPSHKYLPPPARDGLSLEAFALGQEKACRDLARRWEALSYAPSWRRLAEAVNGVGPAHARYLLGQVGIPSELPDHPGPECLARLCLSLQGAAAVVSARSFRFMAYDDVFTALPPADPPQHVREYPSAGSLLDAVFVPREADEKLHRERRRLTRMITSKLERARTRLAAQEQEYHTAQDAEDFRTAGELLKAHLHLIRPGQSEVTVTDYFDPAQGRRTIRLDPRLSPTANVQAYFKRYTRGKRSRTVVEEKLAETHEEIAYLEGVEDSVDNAVDLPELEEVAAELLEAGYLKPEGGRVHGGGKETRRRVGGKSTGPARAGRHLQPIRPLRFLSSDDYPILVGKNNLQNDRLTREASPGDLWLHTKNIPGSHVIVRLGAGPGHPGRIDSLEDVPPRTLHEAAQLAAFHSKARRSSNVPVDYTFRRHVRKPRGARPGAVVYTDHRTVFVTPDDETPSRLKNE